MKKLSFLLTMMAVIVSAKENSMSVSDVSAPNDSKDIPVVEDEVAEVTELTPTHIEPDVISLGEFKLTAYCSCSKCCDEWANNRPVDEHGNEIVIGASGEVLAAGYSVAVDPNLIPYGTELIFNDQVYKAQDCGGAIKDNRIDVYFDSHTEALAFGVQYAEVYMRK